MDDVSNNGLKLFLLYAYVCRRNNNFNWQEVKLSLRLKSYNATNTLLMLLMKS